MAAVGLAIAVLSALLIQEPAREFPAAKESGASAVVGGSKDRDRNAAQEGVAATMEQPEERESFREALGIVFESNTVKLVSWLFRLFCPLPAQQ